MPEPTSSGSLYLPKALWLKGEENFEEFIGDITMLLGSRGLLKYTKEEAKPTDPKGKGTVSTTPSEKSAEQIDAEKAEDETTEMNRMMCAVAIKGSIHTEPAEILKGVTNPAEMMRLLKQRYTAKGWNLQHLYLTEFFHMKIEHFDSVGAFINRFKTLKSKLHSLGVENSETTYTVHFIGLLDSQYSVWADRQRSNARTAPPKLDDLIADILDESRKADRATALYSGKPEKGNKGGKGGGNKGSDKKCDHCEKQGHIAADCWKKHPEKKPDWASKGKRGGKKGVKEDDSGKDDSDLAVVALSVAKPGLDKHSWCFDGGAASHITHTRENLDCYTPNDGSLPTVLTANGPVKPLGSGTVWLEVDGVGGKPLKLELKDVLHLPSVPVNLFSGQLFEKRTAGGYLKKGTLYNGRDEPLAQIESTGSGHFLKIVKEPRFALLARSIKSKPVPLELWHRRLLHVSDESVKDTADITKGILIEASQSEPGLCHACRIGNPIRGVSRTPQERKQKPFDLVHLDVEKVTPTGFNGHNWATLFTDDATRVRWAYSFKGKKEAYHAVVHFNKMVQTQYNTVVKVYRIDGGKEYGGKKLIAHLESQGTLPQVTTPYTPEQNGVAERTIRIIFSKLRPVAEDSGIPPEYWPELLLGTVHITNRTATSSLEKMTPVEAFKRLVQPGLEDSKYIPDMSHIRTLGCKVYVNIPKERRVQSAKLAPRAEVGFLVGFEGSKIYRIYLPGRAHKIVRSSHCVFDEKEPEMELEPEIVPNQGATSQSNDLTPPRGEINQEDAGLDQAYDPLQEANIDTDSDEGSTIEVNDGWEEAPSPSPSPSPAPRKRGRPKGSKNKPKNAEPVAIQLGSEVQEPLNQGSAETLVQPPQDISNRRITRTLTQAPAQPTLFATALLAMQISGYIAAITDQEEPKSVQEAKESPDWPRWLEAMHAELRALLKNGTWLAISHNKGQFKALGAKWVFKIKKGADGQVLQYKARWVVKGYEQRYGLDYDQTFAGVVRAATWRIILALAGANNWAIEQMDVKSAFLHGDIDEQVYVELPTGWELFPDVFDAESGECVLHLQKALYGLKQSPRLWQLTLKAALEKLGYIPLFADQSVYRNAETGLIIITYVDDFLLIGPQGEALGKLKEQLSKEFDMKDLGPCEYFLGVRITRGKGSGQITLCQDAYVRKTLKDFGMENCKAVTTPLDPGAIETLVPYQGSAPKDQIELYQSLVGRINYLAQQTRCDLAFAASALSRFLVNPSPAHIKAGKRVLQYLKGTEMYSITLGGPQYIPNWIDIRLYTDSDYAGDRHTYRSTSGYVVFMAGGPVSWQSKRQSVVAQSSTEAEYIAMSELTKEGTWIRYLLKGVQYRGQDLDPLTLSGDNQGALALAENPTFHRGSKHIAVRYHFIRQEVQKGRLQLAYVPTDRMPADGLTKGLKTPAHARFVKLLGLAKKAEREAQKIE